MFPPRGNSLVRAHDLGNSRNQRSALGARARPRRRLELEHLEPRTLLALLNIAASATRPDIASSVRTNLSYTQVGGDANPFHYDSIPLSITLLDNTVARITKEGNNAPAKTRFDVFLDNQGGFSGGVPGDDYAVNGRVTLGANTFDGQLLTAEATNFGFSDNITPSSAEFDARLIVTGGLLTGPDGPYAVGENLALLIHQPGLKITQFPATFAIADSTSGSSDTEHLPDRSTRLMNRCPLDASDRDPRPFEGGEGGGSNPPAVCPCAGQPSISISASATFQLSSADSGAGVMPYNGHVNLVATDITIQGRGLDLNIARTYRSDQCSDGPLGAGWELNQNMRLQVVTPAKLPLFQSVFPDAQLGDVSHIDGMGRDDLYTLNPDSSYTPPPGYYTELTQQPDGSFTERDSAGVVYQYSPADDMGVATLASVSDREGNTIRYTYDDDEKLILIQDTMGRPIQFMYNSDARLSEIRDFSGRRVRYSYDANGDLVSATTPTVTGTPTANDFPNGKITRYTYSSGFADDRLNHNLLTVTSPNEVESSGPPRVTYDYDTTTGSPAFDRVITQTLGGTNESGVPAGGTITYTYQTLATPPPGDTATPARRTTVIDRNGNKTEYEYNQLNNPVKVTEFTNRDIRPDDPDSFVTRYSYDSEYRRTEVILPLGNTTTFTYDASNPDRFQQGNLLSETHAPDAARRGDQAEITTTFTYEPIYNQVHHMTEPRGNDPSYVPQNGGVQSPERYTTTYTYDFQEGTNFPALAAILGVTAAEVAALLAAAGIPMGLGDVNGDGRTDQISGNLIRSQSPPVRLLPGSNQAVVEGTTTQPIVTTYAYNDFGQLTRTVDPELNVTTYTYYSERDPNGDGKFDNPAGNKTTGGYLKQSTEDTSSNPNRDSKTNPTPTSIRTTYQYDARGNATRVIDGRGIATDYTYNQLDQVVQLTRSAAHGLVAATPSEPKLLTDFQYRERYFYDANDNLVLQQVEDRGNTSNVDGNPPAADLPPYAPNPDPIGGPAYVDTIYKYDILDHRIEMNQEVTNGATPEFLQTRYRYDPNGNQVLTIMPEGNAQVTQYDERDLVFRSRLGQQVPDPTTLLAPSDPTDYNTRGGLSCDCATFRYDANGNVIETVDRDDTDLSPDNNDPTLGTGDRTRYLYDGFDRRTSVVDSVGNQTVTQYDPASNVIRETRFGPVGGASPTSDGPPTLLMPVSDLGVIQSGNLVNANLLSATEYQYDELSRRIQTDHVLFVNTSPTARPSDVADGATSLGKGNLTPGDNNAIAGVAGVTILGRVSDRAEYDRNSRRTFTVEDDGDASRALYDGAGRTIKAVDPQGNSVQFAYDDNSNVIETRATDVSQVAGVPSEAFLTTSFYDSLNRLQSTTDNIGQTTEYRYDSRNNLVSATDANGPAGPVLSRRAFSGGFKTSNVTNTFGNVTRYYYDGLSRRVREERTLTSIPAGSGVSAQGDGVHAGASIHGVKDDASAPESFTPAADAAQGGDGLIRTGFVYDANSLATARVDDQGNVTMYLYDNLNRRVAETKGLVVGSAYTTANIFGARTIPIPTAATIDNPATIPASLVAAQLAEAAARIAAIAGLFPPLADRVDDQPPTTIIWGISPDHNVLIVEDENDSETFYRYDAINRVIAVRIFRSGQADSFAGDSVFAPTPLGDASNPSSAFPAVVGTTMVDYQYDGASRRVRSADNNDPTSAADNSIVEHAYDSLGRIIEEAQTIGGVATKFISSAWRAENLRSKLTYPNDRAEVYTYDKLDHLKSVADEGAAQPIATYDYIGNGRILQRKYPINGTRETFLSGVTDVGYDGLRRPIKLSNVRSNNSLIVGFTQSYDRGNNKLTEAKLHSAPNSESYAYDSAGRLVRFRRGVGGIAPLQSDWTLDGVGNWKQVDAETRAHSSFNEITTRGATPILSDDNGNEFDDGSFTFTWDAMNRLRSVARKSDGLLVAEYTYDALNRRVRKVVTNSPGLDGTTDFYYDGNREIEERDGADALARQYVFGVYLDEPLVIDRNLGGGSTATGAGDQRLFYHQNTQYSVFALTDAAAKIVEGYHYDAYGRATVYAPGPNGTVDFGGDDVATAGGASAVDNPSQFSGQRFDSESGLMFYKSRYYSTEQGRFISRDPLGIAPGAASYYEYASSGPMLHLDPLGLQIKQDCAALTLGPASFQSSLPVPFPLAAIVSVGITGTICDCCWPNGRIVKNGYWKVEVAADAWVGIGVATPGLSFGALGTPSGAIQGPGAIRKLSASAEDDCGVLKIVPFESEHGFWIGIGVGGSAWGVGASAKGGVSITYAYGVELTKCTAKVYVKPKVEASADLTGTFLIVTSSLLHAKISAVGEAYIMGDWCAKTITTGASFQVSGDTGSNVWRVVKKVMGW